jgi:hypothetical protein
LCVWEISIGYAAAISPLICDSLFILGRLQTLLLLGHHTYKNYLCVVTHELMYIVGLV